MATPESNHAIIMGALTQLKLSAVHQKQWSETRAALLWSQPAFSDIWYNMMVDDKGETALFSNQFGAVAATDGVCMMLNPERTVNPNDKDDWHPGYFELKLDERIFVACHEICHNMFGHVELHQALCENGKINYPDGKSLPYEDAIMQKAADLVINAILSDSQVGSMPLYPKDHPKAGQMFGWLDTNVVPSTMGVLDAYRKIYKTEKSKSGQSGSAGSGKGGMSGGMSGGFDKCLPPGASKGKNPKEAKSDRNEQAWATAIAQALASAKLQGNCPAGLERLLGKLLEPTIDWTDKLRSTLTRKLGTSGGSWQTLEHSLVIRGIGAPGRVDYGAGLIIVAVDTSGSISQSMMDRFMSEVGGILDDVKPRELILVQCDAAVHEWVECDDSQDLNRKLLGGGGTSFIPVFERIEAEGLTPDALVYFTDGYGSFPASPPFPVIWADITNNEKLYPWGDIVFVPLKGLGD